MRRLLLFVLLGGLAACGRSAGSESGADLQPLTAEVLDGGVALDGGASAEMGPWEVSGRVLPPQVMLGETFTYELVFTHAKDQRFELAMPKELEEFEVLEQTRQRQDGPERSTTTFQVKLSAFSLGTVKLPELRFELYAPAATQLVAVPGLEVEVTPTLPQSADSEGAELLDYQPPTEIPIRSWLLVWVLLGLLAAGLLVFAGVKWLRRPRAHAVASKPLAPLDVRTRQALDTLKAENLHGRGHAKDFYFRLSEIVRGYLGERYGFEALECTSPELFASLRKLRTPGLPEDKLMRFVSESDMVKYARAEAPPESCEASLAFGYELVEKTYSPPAPPTPESSANAPGPRVP
ncbi:BatD family protein [Stigmatella sp. ncwal1]|uniref:BatD family protein n=1 Tax=Stigmatella ashevillensis TaxID=2995309 RepID=A0ABT5D7P2_9BACT|nr:BatD family protein [Stigmatella ashevillena]MDC0709675.1 BatD family protein [Stigmatella ashevillena]